MTWTIFRSTWRLELRPILPRLLQSALTFSQPFLVNAVVKYAAAKDAPQNTGYGLIGAFALVYTGLAV